MIRVPTHQPPTHPGEMLQEEFLQPMGISSEQLANSIAISREWIDEILDGKRSITPSLALRLARFFGMTPDFWLNLQMCWDLYHVQRAEARELEQIVQYQSVA